MPAGTSNSKTATDPSDSSPSIRNRIASGPTVIGSRVLVVIVLAPSIGWSSDLTVHAILRSVKSLYEWQEKRDPLASASAPEQVIPRRSACRVVAALNSRPSDADVTLGRRHSDAGAVLWFCRVIRGRGDRLQLHQQVT